MHQLKERTVFEMKITLTRGIATEKYNSEDLALLYCIDNDIEFESVTKTNSDGSITINNGLIRISLAGLCLIDGVLSITYKGGEVYEIKKLDYICNKVNPH